MKTLDKIPTSKIQRASKLISTGAKVGVNYLKYYGEKIWDCERLYESKNGFAALILLFNIAENIFKSFKCF